MINDYDNEEEERTSQSQQQELPVVSSIDELEKIATSPRQLAFLRIEQLKLEGEGKGLAVKLVKELRNTLDSWLTLQKQQQDQSKVITTTTDATHHLLRILNLHLRLVQTDLTLGEEMAREGLHRELLRLIQFVSSVDEDDDEEDGDDDILAELHDLAYEVGSCDAKFPLKAVLPFSHDELVARLPLVFTLNVAAEQQQSPEEQIPSTPPTTTATGNNVSVLIHQVTTRQSEQADVGFVMWPSAVVLARYIAERPSIVCSGGKNKTILELGSGCGLVGLSAAMIIMRQHEEQQEKQEQVQEEDGNKASPSPFSTASSSVILSDFNPIVLDNLKRNIVLNNLHQQSTTSATECIVKGLDFYHQSGTTTTTTSGGRNEENEDNDSYWLDLEGNQQKQVDLILGADIICQESDSYAAANTIQDALKPGGMAIIVCGTSNHRFGVDHFPIACQHQSMKQLYITKMETIVYNQHHHQQQQQQKDQEQEKQNNNNNNNSHGLMEDLKQTSGYVPGMGLTMFIIEKKKKE